MASGVRVATITRFFSVDKRSEEELAADRKSALAKWRDEENARLARKEAEAAAEAKRLASKRPVGRPKKVRQAQAVLRGLLAELENPGDEPEVTKDELESGAFRSACIKEIPLVASVQDVMSACLEEEHTLEVFRSLSRQDDELVAELEELENLADLDDVRSAQLSRLRTCAAGLATRLAAVQRRRPRCVVVAAFSLRLAALVPDRIFWQFLTISPVSQQI
ncbi:unnamed protein product [Sphagnum tenellum]